MSLSTQNSVLAKALGPESYEEEEALEELTPGQGVVYGEGGFAAAGDGSKSKRVVREQRNPGGLGVNDNTAPMDEPYPIGANVETIGFPPNAQARCLMAYANAQGTADTDDTYTQGTDLGWNANGNLESVAGAGASEAVAQIAQEDAVTMGTASDPTIVLVEFY